RGGQGNRIGRAGKRCGTACNQRSEQSLFEHTHDVLLLSPATTVLTAGMMARDRWGDVSGKTPNPNGEFTGRNWLSVVTCDVTDGAQNQKTRRGWFETRPSSRSDPPFARPQHATMIGENAAQPGSANNSSMRSTSASDMPPSPTSHPRSWRMDNANQRAPGDPPSMTN